MASILNVDKIRATGSTTDGLTIDSSGRVFTPARPGFRAGSSGANSVTGIIIYDEVNEPSKGQYNTGMYSTTTGKATIPIAGLYFYTAQFYAQDQGASDVVLKLQIGGTGTAHDIDAHYEQGSQNGFPTMRMTGALKLAAGDVLYLNVNSGSAHLNSSKSHFDMYLIG